MKPYNAPGRVQRPSPAWPDFRPTHPAEDLARADYAVRALGAAPPPDPRLYYHAQTPDGRLVATRSNQPVERVLEALERKAHHSLSERQTSNGRPESAPPRSIQVFLTENERSNSALSMTSHPATAQHVQEARWDDTRHLDDQYAPPAYPQNRYAPESPRISERAPAFLRFVHQKTTSRSPLCDTIMTLRIFIELVGDKRLCEITVEDTDKFLHALSVWPVHASKRREFRLMRAPEVVNKARILRTTSLNLRTQQKHVDRLRTFFRWLEKRHEIRPDFLLGIRLYKRGQDFGVHREAFSESDLQLIFDVHRKANFETPYMYWAPLLGLYQGLRVNELSQLYVDDVIQVEGRWCLDITRDRPGQRLKNHHSRRCLPLHPVLLECGFLKFVQQARNWRRATLFPGVIWGINGPGDCVSDWFNRTFLRKRCGIEKPTLTFHSFRHCFATFGEDSEVPDGRLAVMLGHTAGASILRQHYVKLTKPKKLERNLEAIVFPKNEHPRYIPEAYEKAFAKADAEESRQARIAAAYANQAEKQGRLR
jgi:integrase